MAQKECNDVKAMLEEIDKSAPRFIELHKDLDSLDNLDEIGALFLQLKKTLQDNPILRSNLKEWERRSKSIQRIDEIAEKLKKEGSDADLSIDELHALYKQEMRGLDDFSPFNFSYFKHSTYTKTKRLRKMRLEAKKQKEDYARIYGCSPEQVTTNLDDVFRKNNNTVVYFNNINFTEKELPQTLKHVSGSLQSDSKKAKLPKNLEYVGGNLVLDSLKSAEGIILPETIGGDLSLSSLTSAKGLVLPETIGGSLFLSSLESVDGLESLDYTGVRGIVWLPKAFSDKDKEKVEEIKVEQEKKGINVIFLYN